MFWESEYQGLPVQNPESPRMYEHSGDYMMVESPNSKFQDLSAHNIGSPVRMSCDDSPMTLMIRRPSEDCLDGNTQDSGFSSSESNQNASPTSNKAVLSAIDEEGFVDLSDFEADNEEGFKKLPQDFDKLVENTLVQNPKPRGGFNRPRPPLRKALSLLADFNNVSPMESSPIVALSKIKTSPFRDINAVCKRADPPNELISPVTTKRSKQGPREIKRIGAKPIFRHCISDGDMIKTAMQRSSTDSDLIGDFSKPFCLPLVEGRHSDLKAIAPLTLANLIRGHYCDSVESFQIIDCRYPYEYNGGHIRGATNFYNRDQIINELLNAEIKKEMSKIVSQNTDKRRIVVFHCEFSSERGPNLSRYLRNIDRSQNMDFYPFLHFPEVYLLEGGYKSFFENHPDLCDPHGYLPMLHPDHKENLKHFRAKSKTWNCDAKRINKHISKVRI